MGLYDERERKSTKLKDKLQFQGCISSNLSYIHPVLDAARIADAASSASPVALFSATPRMPLSRPVLSRLVSARLISWHVLSKRGE